MPHDYVETKTELPREGARVAWPWDIGEIHGKFVGGMWKFKNWSGDTFALRYTPKRWRYLKPDEL